MLVVESFPTARTSHPHEGQHQYRASPFLRPHPAWCSRGFQDYSSSSLFSNGSDEPSEKLHIVSGIRCREVPLELPIVGTVTVLEATADSQNDLVDAALEEEQDDPENNMLRSGDPYGAVLWPAAWAVAKYMLETMDLTKISILELGTGTGLVSLAASLGGCQDVIATDYEPLALKLVDYASQNLQSKPISIETELLDMCSEDVPLPQVDLIVAADVMYEPKTGIALAHRVVQALKQNSRVVVGDSPGRAGRPAFLKTLQELGIDAEFRDATGKTCDGPRHELICGPGSTSVSETPKELPVAILDLVP